MADPDISELEGRVRSSRIPHNIGFIMDGNRRYAREILNTDPLEGHRAGKDNLDRVLHWCLDLGVHTVTTYAFSTENFNRPPDEVEYLMDLLADAFIELADSDDASRYSVRIRAIGDVELLPDKVRGAIEYAESKTIDNDGHLLNMAVAYGGRQELVHAVRELVCQAESGSLHADDVDEKLVSSALWTCGEPDPELIIRTSGEKRISNFFLWQCAYSELHFCDSYWPMFSYRDLLVAIDDYQRRTRRFGT